MKRAMRKPEDRKNDTAHKRADGEELSAEELEQQQAAELPDREAMSLINANLAVPVNAALAANILSDGSAAGAAANQTGQITQGI